MSGHSKWQQIKHKKGATDKKKAVIFSKILKTIRAAAKEEPNPEFNPRLRTTIQKAKAEGVSQDSIERAISRAKESGSEEITVEAYGEEGTAFVIRAVADNKNRLMAEIKQIFSNFGAKLAEPGAVLWAFERKDGELIPKFKQTLSASAKNSAKGLLDSLAEKEEITEAFTNADI